MKQDAAALARSWLEDREAADLYTRLAADERDPERKEIFRELAAAESRHADHWASLIAQAGGTLPKYRPRARTRLLGWLIRRLGPAAALPAMRALELGAAFSDLQHDRQLASESRMHSRLVSSLGVEGSGHLARYERWHRAASSGTLRAAVFGVNDGLVSNLALVMGVVGASSGAGRAAVLAGIAGLFAGAFSMSAGEYISMRSQRELLERQIALEAEELETMPEAEREELALLYRAKGIPKEEAEALADRLLEDPEVALDSLVREELGVDPSELGSPWGAAGSSFVTFAFGALIPLLPVALLGPAVAVWASIAVSALALFGVGAALSLVTGRSAVRSGARMLVVGGAAAAVTFGIGTLVGVAVG